MADAQDERVKKLRATRDDYGAQLVWHKFLIDAYTGCGGFSGKVKQPETGFLGWAAEAYAIGSLNVAGLLNVAAAGDGSDSYLDKYPREDVKKFQRRRDVAHYSNFVEAILEILLSYVLKRPMIRDAVPDQITGWSANADGRGTTWDALLSDVVKPRSALLGWTPVMFDMPRSPAANLTRAQTDALGITPRAIPLYPANLLDWETDDTSRFLWAKIRIDQSVRPSPLGERTKLERYLIWYPDRVQTYDVAKIENIDQVIAADERPHSFGSVPVVIWRHKPSPDDPVIGLGMVDSVALKCRRLFNLESELDEHLRQQVFALLQVPYVGQPPTELVGGTDNALGLPAEAKHEYKFIAPPESVAATYEKRIERTVQDIYRLARVEYDRASSGVGAATSGVARAYEFEKTNRRLGDFAKQLAAAEQQSYQLVGAALGVGPETLKPIKITAPTDFRVEDLATDIKNALDAITMELPPSAEFWLKKRVIEKMLPNLPEDAMAEIVDELEDKRDTALNEQAAAGEVDDEGNEDPEDGAGDEEVAGDEEPGNVTGGT